MTPITFDGQGRQANQGGSFTPGVQPDPANIIENVGTVAASGAALTLADVSTYTIHNVTLTANCALTFPAATPGKSFLLFLTQDTSGSRTVTFNNVIWPSSTPPVLSTGAGSMDVFTFVCVTAGTWFGFVGGQNFP